MKNHSDCRQLSGEEPEPTAGRFHRLISTVLHMKRTIVPLIFTILITFLPVSGATPEPREIGFRVFSHYSDRDYPGGTQNFQVVHDSRGMVYVGNLAGVLQFDGIWWRLIPLANDTAAFSVGLDAEGNVAAGGINEFGLLLSDPVGELQYHSLSNRLPEAIQDFGEVWNIVTDGRFTYFVTTHNLFRWDGRHIRSIRAFPDSALQPAGFSVNNTVYVWSGTGLQQMVDGEPEPVSGGERFANRKVLAMMETDGPGLAVVIRDGGLFNWQGRTLTPMAPGLAPWFSMNHLFGGCRLTDGRYLLYTRRGGAVILNPDGSISEQINSALGLADDRINHAFVGTDGALWLALNLGISRVDISSPLSVFDERAGLTGSVYTICRHNGQIHIGTAFGVFVLKDVEQAAGRRETAPTAPRLHLLPGLESGGWDLLSTDDTLLVGTSAGIVEVRNGRRPRLIENTGPVTAYLLVQSTSNPDHVYVGTRRGLGILVRKAGRWTFAGIVPDTPPQIRSIAEAPDGTVWTGTTLHGVAAIRLAKDDPTWQTPQSVVHLEKGERDVHLVNGDILVTGKQQILRATEEMTLEPDPRFGEIKDYSLLYVMQEGPNGRVWLNTRPPSVAVPQDNGTYMVDNSLLRGLIHGVIPVILPEPNGVVWMGTDRAVYRYDGRIPWQREALKPPLIHKVTADDHRLSVPDGARGGLNKPRIPHGSERIRFEYTAVSFQPDIQYQFRLYPDTDWSPWQDTAYTEFTDLWEGNYRFEVRTRNAQMVSAPARFIFRIRPPWFRSHPAITLYILLIIGTVVAIVRIRSSQLERKARELEKLVDEQTARLAEAKQSVEEKNRQLEAANTRLKSLSFMDSLTGIANRRKMEETLHKEWKRAFRRKSPLGLIMVDLDWFKQLNDRHGHGEGDECLKRIGAYLAERVQRSGDLAARIGGEEFAIILPDTDLEGLHHIAEDIRAEIESMNIINTGSPYDRITASLGLAVCRPHEGNGGPDGLMKAADEQLYEAKRAGKNCVRPGRDTATDMMAPRQYRP